jgi:hypothetical protein
MANRGSRRRHRGNGRFVKDPQTTQRHTEMAKRYAEGATFTELAAEFGYTDRHNARKALLAFLEETAKPAEDARRRAIALNKLLVEKALDVMDRPHLAHSNGRIVEHNGKPVLDDGPILQAIGEVRQLETLRARYEGTFAPTQQQVQTTIATAGDDTWQEVLRTAHDRRAKARAQMETPPDDPATQPPTA